MQQKAECNAGHPNNDLQLTADIFTTRMCPQTMRSTTVHVGGISELSVALYTALQHNCHVILVALSDLYDLFFISTSLVLLCLKVQTRCASGQTHYRRSKFKALKGS